MWYDRELSYSDDITGMDGDGGFGEGKVISSYSVRSDVMAIVMSTCLRKTSLECKSIKIAWDTRAFGETLTKTKRQECEALFLLCQEEGLAFLAFQNMPVSSVSAKTVLNAGPTIKMSH